MAIGLRLIGAKRAQQLKNLLRLGKAIAHHVVITHIHQEIGLKWIDLLVASGITLLTQTEHHTRHDHRVSWIGRHHGVQTKRRFFEHLSVAFDVLRQLDAEVIERKLIQRDTFAEIFKIEYLVL